MPNFLILIEMLKNCNHIYRPDRALSFKQWLFDFMKITRSMEIMKISGTK